MSLPLLPAPGPAPQPSPKVQQPVFQSQAATIGLAMQGLQRTELSQPLSTTAEPATALTAAPLTQPGGTARAFAIPAQPTAGLQCANQQSAGPSLPAKMQTVQQPAVSLNAPSLIPTAQAGGTVTTSAAPSQPSGAPQSVHQQDAGPGLPAMLQSPQAGFPSLMSPVSRPVTAPNPWTVTSALASAAVTTPPTAPQPAHAQSHLTAASPSVIFQQSAPASQSGFAWPASFMSPAQTAAASLVSSASAQPQHKAAAFSIPASMAEKSRRIFHFGRPAASASGFALASDALATYSTALPWVGVSGGSHSTLAASASTTAQSAASTFGSGSDLMVSPQSTTTAFSNASFGSSQPPSVGPSLVKGSPQGKAKAKSRSSKLRSEGPPFKTSP